MTDRISLVDPKAFLDEWQKLSHEQRKHYPLTAPQKRLLRKLNTSQRRFRARSAADEFWSDFRQILDMFQCLREEDEEHVKVSRLSTTALCELHAVSRRINALFRTVAEQLQRRYDEAHRQRRSAIRASTHKRILAARAHDENWDLHGKGCPAFAGEECGCGVGVTPMKKPW